MDAFDPDRAATLIHRFIVDELVRTPGVAVDLDDNLFTSGYVDSVGVMRLIAYLETAFALEVPPTDLVPANFRTVRVMAAYLATRHAVAGAVS